MKKLFIVDGFSLLFRSYYASKHISGYLENEEIPSGAIRIFFNSFFKAFDAISPDHVLIIFDYDGKAYRKDKFELYKANRTDAPEDFKKQVIPTKELINLFGYQYIEAKGYEADDYIGTVANKYQNKFKEIVIMSGDKDLWQLINSNIFIAYPNSKNDRFITEKVFAEKFDNLKPKQLIDLKALIGDSSDNYPGVKGIGHKAAIKLISQFENIENLYLNIDKVMPLSVKQKLIDNKESAFLSYELAKLKLDIKIEEFNITDCQLKMPNQEKLMEFLEEYKLFSLMRKI